MSGQLDLAAIEVLGVAECDLGFPRASAHEWPCPGCGALQRVDRAWALKIRNRSGQPLERAVVVCRDCFAEIGDLMASQVTDEPVTISDDEDPVELLRGALDTDDVDLPFRN